MTPRLLLNPAAGGSRALAALRVAAAARDLHVVEPSRPAQVELEARRAVEAGDERLIVAGGDGTIHAALPSLVGTRTALGLVPCGRGNDLARALCLPTDPARALERALVGRRRTIDLGRWNDRPFAGALSVGLDAAVADRVRARRGGSSARYGTEAVRELRRFTPATVRLATDGGPATTPRVWLLAISNSGIYGGGMRIAPSARLDDGLLDLIVLRDVSRWRLAALLPAVYLGWHVSSRAVELRRIARAELSLPDGWLVFADGEPMARSVEGPGQVRVDPAAIDVVV